MTEEAAPPSVRTKSGWLRRLPLLLVAAIGFFYFLPQVPHDVELDFDLGLAARGVQRAELEIFDPAGHSMHRTVLEGELARHPSQHARLSKGTYRVELKLTYADRVERRSRPFNVDEAERLDLDVEKP